MSQLEIDNRLKLSVVVPAFNEEKSLLELCNRIEKMAEDNGIGDCVELIVVDDGSTDKTPEILQEMALDNENFRPVRLRRNSGKSLALMAGFRQARGDYVVMIDADLQDRPEDIGTLLHKLAKGYDVVTGWRQNRRDTGRRKFVSSLFNFAVQRFTGLALHDSNCGLKAFRREVVEHLCIYGHHHRYLPLHAHFAGFKVTEAIVTNDTRKFGESKYRTLRYEGIFDLMTIIFNHKYGHNPMHFFGPLSAIIALPSSGFLLWSIYQQLMHWSFGGGFQVENRPMFAMSLTALILSIIIFLTGFVCDFLLHHRIRDRIDEIIHLSTDQEFAQPTKQAIDQDCMPSQKSKH
jgi:glycosyltransferase involved in cell wall biosynthesis